jgi:hypothetical protein
MWILPLVGYAGAIIGFCFLTMAIASGLYYLSELVEEHTVLAKKLLTKLIYTIIGAQALLWLVDGFPMVETLKGIFSLVVYLGNMRRFPFVKLTDPLFLLSCGTYLGARAGPTAGGGIRAAAAARAAGRDQARRDSIQATRWYPRFSHGVYDRNFMGILQVPWKCENGTPD